jgi:hypothetical protein
MSFSGMNRAKVGFMPRVRVFVVVMNDLRSWNVFALVEAIANNRLFDFGMFGPCPNGSFQFMARLFGSPICV